MKSERHAAKDRGPQLQAMVQVMEQAARLAGARILAVARRGFQVEDKNAAKLHQNEWQPAESGSPNPSASMPSVDPVTAADREADALIREFLLGAFPDHGWLSEESADDGSRWRHPRVWVVDPLDGTREFVRGRPEFTVSIGLLDQGQPVAGVVYNPSTDTLHCGDSSGVRVNGRRVQMRSSVDTPPRILASRSEVGRGQFREIEGLAQVMVAGSIASKLARLAAGEGDLCLSFSPKSEWDLAAGVAMIRCNGGEVFDLEGVPLRFNRKTPSYTGLIATTPAGTPLGLELAQRGERFPPP